MSVSITDNHPVISNETTQKASIFLRQVAEEIVRISTPGTPMKTGALRRSVLKEVLGLKGKVQWNKEYAAKMEEVQFKNYTTPGTNKDFAKNAVFEVANKTGGIAKSSGLIL